MNIYKLNKETYINRSAFVSDLANLVKNHKPFEINYPLSDQILQKDLAEIFEQYNVRAFIEQPSYKEIESMAEKNAKYGYLAGAISGYYITGTDTFTDLVGEAYDAASDAVTSIITEVVSEQASEQVGEVLSNISPLIGATAKILTTFFLARGAKKLGDKITRKYIVRSTCSSHDLGPNVGQLVFSPA